jgi:hypothetical protein
MANLFKGHFHLSYACFFHLLLLLLLSSSVEKSEKTKERTPSRAHSPISGMNPQFSLTSRVRLRVRPLSLSLSLSLFFSISAEAI